MTVYTMYFKGDSIHLHWTIHPNKLREEYGKRNVVVTGCFMVSKSEWAEMKAKEKDRGTIV